MADVRAGTSKVQDKPGICCLGRKTCSKINIGQGGVGETCGLSKNTGTSLLRLPLAKPRTTWKIKIMTAMDLTTE